MGLSAVASFSKLCWETVLVGNQVEICGAVLETVNDPVVFLHEHLFVDLLVVKLLGDRVMQNKRFVLILTKLGLRIALEDRTPIISGA